MVEASMLNTTISNQILCSREILYNEFFAILIIYMFSDTK